MRGARKGRAARQTPIESSPSGQWQEANQRVAKQVVTTTAPQSNDNTQQSSTTRSKQADSQLADKGDKAGRQPQNSALYRSN